MALPSTVTGAWSDWLNARHGPFYPTGGNVYVFTIDTTNNKIRVYKSTDGGSSWTEQDASNAPAINTTSGKRNMWADYNAAYSTSKMVVGYIDNSGNGRVIEFDSSGDTWGTASTTTGAPAPEHQHSSATMFPCAIAVRSNGDVFYAYNKLSTQYRVWYRKLSGGTWGSEVQVSSNINTNLGPVVVGLSDRVHFWYAKTDATTGGRHRSLNSSDTLDTEQTFTGPSSNTYMLGQACYDSVNDRVWCIVGTGSPVGGSNARRYTYCSSSASPTMHQLTATSRGSEVTASNPGAPAMIGNNLYVFLVEPSQTPLFRDCDGGALLLQHGAGGTDDPASWVAGVTPKGVNAANKSTSTAGVFYSANGTPTYNEYAQPTALPAAEQDTGHIWSAHRNKHHGPYLISGNLYKFLPGSAGHDFIRALKSIDGGLTWFEPDGAHDPATNTAAAQKSCDCFDVTTTVYVSYLDTSSRVIVRSFASDVWGTASATTNAPVAVADITSQFQWFLVVRSTGSYVVFYQSATETVGGTARRRFSYREYSAGAWGSAVQFGTGVAAHYDLRAIVLGTSDRIDVIYTKSSVANTIFRQSLDSSNSLDTESSWAGSSADNYDVGLPYYDGTNVYIPYKDNTSTDLYVAYWASGANPSISTRAASAFTPEVSASNPGLVTQDSSANEQDVMVRSSDRDVYRNDSDVETTTAVGVNALVYTP